MGTGAGGRKHGLCRIGILSRSGFRSSAAAVARALRQFESRYVRRVSRRVLGLEGQG